MLVDNNFDKIRKLNVDLKNETFADISCEKDDVKYIISTKARNKFQKNGKLNTRYNLGKDVYEKALDSEKKFNAKACWLAIQFDHNSFSIYFGKLNELNGSKPIPVNKCKNRIIGDTWVYNRRHYFDFDYYSNKEK